MVTLPKWVVKMALCYPHNTFIRPPTEVCQGSAGDWQRAATNDSSRPSSPRPWPAATRRRNGGLELTNHLVKISGWWFQPTPLKKWWSSSDWIIIPNLVGENNPNVPNHQPDIDGGDVCQLIDVDWVKFRQLVNFGRTTLHKCLAFNEQTCGSSAPRNSTRLGIQPNKQLANTHSWLYS